MRTLSLSRNILLVFLLGLLTFYSCKKKNGSVSDSPSKSAAKYISSQSLNLADLDQLNIDVRMLLAENCFKCHNSTKHKGALVLDTKEGIFEGGETGPILEINNSRESEIIRRLKLPSRNEDAMPPEGKRLSKDQIDMLALWIDQGAHWADTTLKLFREAPIALSQPALPTTTADLSHPIDLWVNQYFNEHNIRWPRTIEDHRFIRKVYLDITGLLPPPGEISAFAANQEEDKYEQLVDGLLSDKKNYTLHWFSFWNDLLRNDYSGTGYIDGGRKQISDWLYNALIVDKPYDEFVAELIDPTEESEGFIKGIQWRGAVNASQRRELQAAQNVSQSFLGLNLKCASCHNSFVNNVSLQQAYAFANVFADTSLEIYQCDKPTGKFTAANFIYPELGVVQGDSLREKLNSLAGIMVSPENGRLYRTIVNRFWDRLFGRGLVTPVDDMDQLPWSQDLLDWLAADFINSSFDLKHLLRTILTSKTYRLAPSRDDAPDILNKPDFTFRGPVLRRLSAEQFIDAFTTNIYPFYSGIYYNQTVPDGDPKWIWHREIEFDRTVLPKPGARWFRHKFSLNEIDKIKHARLVISVDSAFTLFLNQEEIAKGEDWRKVVKTSIPVELLQEENCMALFGQNDGLIANPAGILLTLEISYGDYSECVVSDRGWVSTDTLPGSDWKRLEFVDTAWAEVRSYGSTGYWGFLTDFTLGDQANDIARAALVKKDQFMLSLGRPTRENVTTKRDEEATLLQAMTLSNDDLLADNIRRGAQKWKSDDPHQAERNLQNLFYHLIGRMPTKKEKNLLLTEISTDKASVEAWEDIIWALIMLPEFHLI